MGDRASLEPSTTWSLPEPAAIKHKYDLLQLFKLISINKAADVVAAVFPLEFPVKLWSIFPCAFFTCLAILMFYCCLLIYCFMIYLILIIALRTNSYVHYCGICPLHWTTIELLQY